MKIKKFIGMIVLALFLVIDITTAQLGIPHQFWGSITDSNGNPAHDGELVIARMNGQDVSATTTKDGYYGYKPIFYVQDPKNNRDGKLIEFYIRNVKVAESIFQNGGTDELNLISTAGFSVAPPVNEGSSGNSGGSSGGGSIIDKSTSSKNDSTELTKIEVCEEKWECSDWLDCSGSVQKKVCTDLNNCGTTNNKPEESKECLNDEVGTSSRPFFSRILGAVIGVGGDVFPWGAIIFIAVVFVLAVVIFVRKRNRK